MVEELKLTAPPQMETPSSDVAPGRQVYVDGTPMTGRISGIERNKKGKITKYIIRMTGVWPRNIKRSRKDISPISEGYNRELWKGPKSNWPNVNPSNGGQGSIISFMGIHPKPGIYYAENTHNCPSKGRIMITIGGKTGQGKGVEGTATLCLACGAHPTVMYEMGEFSFFGGTIIGTNPLVVFGKRRPFPGIYIAQNYHYCPNKGTIRIVVHKDGSADTRCLACGAHPIVTFDRGQFSYRPTAFGPNPTAPLICRCCGKPITFTYDNYPIHTGCISKHWGQHAYGKNASRCKEFGPGVKRRRNPDDNTIVTSEKRYCDICAEQGNKGNLAWYDGRTKMGMWANMCREHFQMLGVGLGPGKGQVYQYQPKHVAEAPPAEDKPRKGQKIYVFRGGRVRTLKDDLSQEQIDAYFVTHPDAYRTTKPPTIETMMRWEESGIARATDGCKVEPDGTCPHGRPSWLKVMGIMNPKRNPGMTLYDLMKHNHRTYIKYAPTFQHYFGVPLGHFWDTVTGFDVVRFDEVLVKPNTKHTGKSTADVVEELYGKEALDFITGKLL